MKGNRKDVKQVKTAVGEEREREAQKERKIKDKRKEP